MSETLPTEEQHLEALKAELAQLLAAGRLNEFGDQESLNRAAQLQREIESLENLLHH